MLLRIFLVLAALVIFVGTLAGIKALQIKTMISQTFSMPPETVEVAEAVALAWENTVPAIGTLRADQGTQLAVEAPGIIASINFTSGASVKAGDLLLKLDTTVEEAQLTGAKARLSLASLNERRLRELAASRSAPLSDLDQAVASLSEAEAEVARLNAVIRQKSLRAPFAGTVGINTLTIGQFLQAGQGVVSLQSLESLRVDFTLPQQRVADLRPGQKLTIAADAYPGREFVGELVAVEPSVDAGARAVKAEARIANADGALRPGMFVTLDLALGSAETVVAIPSTSLLYAPYGDSVFVIDSKAGEGGESLVARKEIVRLGPARGDLVVVREGVKAGERVVTKGAFKLRNGSAVVFGSSGAAPASLNPKPENK
jgi:membrane fusion protein (multidrug efflux system)